MPELPEVEAAKRLLERGCMGKRIEKAVVADDNKVFAGATPDQVRRALEGRRVLHVHRKGKYMWLELDNPEGPWPLLHFGMTGGIVVQKMGASKYKRIHLESDPDEWPPRFTKLELDLEGGAKLAFVDARRFARVKLLANPQAQEPLSKLGFDVLDELPPPDQFAAAVRKRVARAPALKIKALLLDQEFCSGIGNWVGDEVLYQARIHPEQSAASLDDAALAALHAAIRSVVGLAVEAEADADRFPRDWLFHYRWTNKKPSSVNGHKIEFVTVGSRTSAFVPALQKLTGNGGGARAGGAGGGGRTRAKAEAGGRQGQISSVGPAVEAPVPAPAPGHTSLRASRKRGRASAKKDESEEEESEEEQNDTDEDEEGEEYLKTGNKGGGTKAAASKRASGKSGGKSSAVAAAKKNAGGSQRGKKRKAESDSEEEEDEPDEESQSGGDSDEDSGSEEEDQTEEPAPKKRPTSKAAAAPAKKGKKGAGGGAAAAAAGKRQAQPRGRRSK